MQNPKNPKANPINPNGNCIDLLLTLKTPHSFRSGVLGFLNEAAGL
tara:strand:- start:74 stop:211 length:138 start_codon:yes stop_codon:yes gene_type:complete